MAERVAVGLLDRRADCRADVREEQVRLNVTGQLAQVLVVSGWLDAAEGPRGRRGVIPADAEPVAVGVLASSREYRLCSDQRMDGGVEPRVSRTGCPV
jgi:hypothetical protein